MPPSAPLPTLHSQPSQTAHGPARAARALFAANDAVHGWGIWTTNGTAAGTALLAPVSESFFRPWTTPDGYTRVRGGRLVFRATGPDGTELWVTDGTRTGTGQLKDIPPVRMSSAPDDFFSLDRNRALFAASGTAGRELWITDGTAAGTRLVRDIGAGPGDGVVIPNFTALGDGRVLFTALDAAHGAELWITDGTAVGTRLFQDIKPGADGSSPDYAAAPVVADSE
jgi:ELWxxDGT repeat protein